MIPLHRDRDFTFRFAEDRMIPRFHLEGVETGRSIAVYRLNPETGGRLDLITTAVTGDGGWVTLAEPILVRAGEGFIAVPSEPGA
ncbi:hypothetical protein [Limnoglobus roseus]|nr:hypothetical protein [Limnoglobus roseus]